MNEEIELIDYWRRYDNHKDLIGHPDDGFNNEKDPFFNSTENRYVYTGKTYKEYLEQRRERKNVDLKNSIHAGLIPYPYSGNIRDAKIYLLMANPGFIPLNYIEEDKGMKKVNHSSRRSYCEAKMKVLHQDFTGIDYPVLELDPSFWWTGGSEYKRSKLSDYLEDEQIWNKLNPESDPYRWLVNNLAVLQLYPYHSESFDFTVDLEKMMETSKNKMVQFVKNELMERAQNEDIMVFCMRSVDHWGIEDQADSIDNVIIFPTNSRRGASISYNTDQGERLRGYVYRQLGINE